MKKQRTMCRRSQHIAAASGSPGSRHPLGTMGTTTMSPSASLSRIAILATVLCLCVCRGLASDEEPQGSAEVVNTLWDDDNPEFRDVLSMDDMDEGMDMMDREARKITRAHMQGLIRKKQKEAIERLPVEERPKKRAELRAKQREELELRLRSRNEKPIKIVSPFFRNFDQPPAAAAEETVGSRSPEKISVPAVGPSSTLPPDQEGSTPYKSDSSVEDEEHIALSPSETTIEPAVSTDSASESQQATGAPPTSTDSQELESGDVTRQVMTDVRGDSDVTAESTTPSALEKDFIKKESGTFEQEASSTFTPDVYSTTRTETTTVELWKEPEWPTTPVPTAPALWIHSTIHDFRHQPTTAAPWNESIVNDWQNQQTTPKPWTEISTSRLHVQSTSYAEPTTPEPWTDSTTYGLHYQPTTYVPTTPQPLSYISTPGLRVQPTYAEQTTPEPWTESTNHVFHYQPNTGAPTTPEPWADKTTPNWRTQPTNAAPTTLETATEWSGLEVATDEVPSTETTTAPWPRIPAPQMSDRGPFTSRQSIEDIVGRLEKLLSVTASPPINTHRSPVNHDPFLGAAQPVEFAVSGRKPSRLSSASLGMAVPDYADHALQTDRHRERLRPPPAWQGQAAPQTYNAPPHPWEVELPPTGFQEPLPTIHSVPGFGPQNNFVGYSHNAVPYQGDINMMLAHLPDHARLRDPAFANRNGHNEEYGGYLSAHGNTQHAPGSTLQDPVLSVLSDVNLPSVPNQTLFGLRDLTPAQAANTQNPYQSTGREVYPSRPVMYAGPYMQLSQGISAVPPPQISSHERPRIYSIRDNIIPETPYEKMRSKAFDEWKDALTKKKAEAIRRANAAAAASTTLTRPQRSTYIPGTASVPEENPVTTDSHYVTPGTSGVPTAAEFEESLRESRANSVNLPPVRPPRPGLRHTVQKRDTTVHSAQTPSLDETWSSSHVSVSPSNLKPQQTRRTSSPVDVQDESFYDHSQVHKPIMTVLPPNSLRKSNELRASYFSGEEVDARPFRNSSQDDAEIIVPVLANMGRFTAPKRFPVMTNATIMRIVFPRHKNSEFSSGGDFPDSNFSSPKKWTSAKVDGVESPMLTALLLSNFSRQAVTSPELVKNLQFATKSAHPVSKLEVAMKGAARDCEDGKCKTCKSWNCVHSSKGENEIRSRQKRSDHVISEAVFAHQLSFFGS